MVTSLLLAAALLPGQTIFIPVKAANMYTIIQAARKFGIPERDLRIEIKAGRVDTQMISKHDLVETRGGMPLKVRAISETELERFKNEKTF
jgi:hypothetical protein